MSKQIPVAIDPSDSLDGPIGITISRIPCMKTKYCITDGCFNAFLEKIYHHWGDYISNLSHEKNPSWLGHIRDYTTQ